MKKVQRCFKRYDDHRCGDFLISKDQIEVINEDNSYRFYKYHHAYRRENAERKYLTKRQHWEIVQWFWKRVSDDIVSNEGGVVFPFIGYICNIVRGWKKKLAERYLQRDSFFYFPFGVSFNAYGYYYFKASKELYSRVLTMRRHKIKYKTLYDEALEYLNRYRQYSNENIRPVLDMRAYYGRGEVTNAKKWMESLKDEY